MRLSDWFEGLRKIDINDLDTNNIGSWPPAIKALAGVLLMILVLALGYSFSTSDLETRLELNARGRVDPQGAIRQQSPYGGESGAVYAADEGNGELLWRAAAAIAQ